jgi:hypothetical protein
MHDVPKIILEQLGGRRFIAMTGAKHFVGSADTLRFQLPCGTTTNKATHVAITLTWRDTYTVAFLKVHKLTCTTLDTREDIYAENLQEVFTRATGLYTHL